MFLVPALEIKKSTIIIAKNSMIKITEPEITTKLKKFPEI